jgi:hypothetical protein
MRYTLLTVAIAGLALAPVSPRAGEMPLSAQDYAEIQQLYARYNVAIDTGDAEAYAATFTADGVFNNLSGHDALLGFIKTWRERLNGASRRHWNANLLISGDGKTAVGSVYLMLLDVSTKPASIAAVGSYTDSLIKTTQGWRFTKRTTHMDGAPPAAGAPTSGSK